MTKNFDIKEIYDVVTLIGEHVENKFQRMVHQDAFAVGCYLYMIGQDRAGRKICLTVLDAINHKNTDRILKNIKANAALFLDSVGAHGEVSSDLLTKEQRTELLKDI